MKLSKPRISRLLKAPDKPYIRDSRSPIPLNTNVSRVMRANKSKDSIPELIVRKWLYEKGYKGYRINSRKLPGRPDICFQKFKTAIFVHGCFWHRCPLCTKDVPKNNRNFWTKKFENNISRDNKKIEELTRLGWKTLVIWECEVKPSLDKRTIKKLKQLLSKNEKTKEY
jgi:DNA mismatch endonuclease (patch repair protein)